MLDVVKYLNRKISASHEIGWYTLLTILIMGPMLLPGYILALDMVFTPNLPAPTELSNTFLFEWLLHITNFILPGQIIQKILIFAILLLCGISAHRLINTKSAWPKYFAGIFYMVNPYTYERWMAGQYLVLAGYALLPFLLKSLIGFSKTPTRKGSLHLSLWYTAIALVSIHVFVLAAIAGAVFLTVYMAAKPKKPDYRTSLAKYSGLATLLTAILNSSWLIKTLIGSSQISNTIDAIGSADLQAFATASNASTGLFFNVLSMYGFWLEDDGRFSMPNTNFFIWVGGFALLAVLIILGARGGLQNRSRAAISLAIIGFVGLFVALGVNAPVVGPVNSWIIEHVPLMRGFRDTQKFSALLVLAYVYFAAHGLDYLLAKAKDWPQLGQEGLRIGALILPILYVSTMPLGFAGQLKPVDYPKSWYSFNNQLQSSPAKGKILFLPWHQYMSYDFTPRVIANPAPQFFYNAKVISGTNAEFGGIAEANPSADSRYVDSKVLSDVRQGNMGAKLAKIDVQYVLLSEGYDHQRYGFLDKQDDLELVSRQPGLAVYRNEAFKNGQ